MANKKAEPGAPLWILTFSDMMSLLLVFFIMLFVISTVDETKSAVMVETFNQQFGNALTQIPAPGRQPPNNSNRSHIASAGRARTNDTLKGGNPVLAPHGDHPKVRTVRMKADVVQGGVVYFELGSDELTEQSRNDIRIIADQLRGTPFKIMVRGHTSIERGIYSDMYDLGYARAKAVRDELIRLGVNGKLIQTTSVGPDEPIPANLSTGTVSAQQANAFVEVFRLLELAKDFEGDRTERETTD